MAKQAIKSLDKTSLKGNILHVQYQGEKPVYYEQPYQDYQYDDHSDDRRYPRMDARDQKKNDREY